MVTKKVDCKIAKYAERYLTKAETTFVMRIAENNLQVRFMIQIFLNLSNNVQLHLLGTPKHLKVVDILLKTIIFSSGSQSANFLCVTGKFPMAFQILCLYVKFICNTIFAFSMRLGKSL